MQAVGYYLKCLIEMIHSKLLSVHKTANVSKSILLKKTFPREMFVEYNTRLNVNYYSVQSFVKEYLPLLHYWDRSVYPALFEL